MITLCGIAVAPLDSMLTRDHRQARGSIWLLVFGAFVLIGAFFLLQEHRAHVLGALPYLLGFAALFFCMFGHGHGARDHRGGDR